MTPSSDKEELAGFICFLEEYKGGYVRRSAGTIVKQEYLNKEKGDLNAAKGECYIGTEGRFFWRV